MSWPIRTPSQLLIKKDDTNYKLTKVTIKDQEENIKMRELWCRKYKVRAVFVLYFWIYFLLEVTWHLYGHKLQKWKSVKNEEKGSKYFSTDSKYTVTWFYFVFRQTLYNNCCIICDEELEVGPFYLFRRAQARKTLFWMCT